MLINCSDRYHPHSTWSVTLCEMSQKNFFARIWKVSHSALWYARIFSHGLKKFRKFQYLSQKISQVKKYFRKLQYLRGIESKCSQNASKWIIACMCDDIWNEGFHNGDILGNYSYSRISHATTCEMFWKLAKKTFRTNLKNFAKGYVSRAVYLN